MTFYETITLIYGVKLLALLTSLERIPHEMVEILLCVASVSSEIALSKLPDPPIREFFPPMVAHAHRLSYPRIHGKGLVKIEGIEEHAIGDLFSNTGKRHELFLGISVFQSPQCPQIHGFGPPAYLQEISGPESRLDFPQIPALADPNGGGKSITPIVTHGYWLSIMATKAFQYAFNVGDILCR